MPHPLLDVLLAAFEGHHPPVDGGVTFLPELASDLRAVVSLTGHSFVLSQQGIDDFADLVVDGFGAALGPEMLLRVADGGVVDDIDVIVVAAGKSGTATIQRTDQWDDHSRVVYARRYRSNVAVYGDERGFVTVADGLAGRPELSIEVMNPGGDPGFGRRLLDQGLLVVDEGTPLFAAVSPGNARSLRSFLGAGFKPLGSQVLIDRGAAKGEPHV